MNLPISAHRGAASESRGMRVAGPFRPAPGGSEFHRIENRFASVDAVLHRASSNPTATVVVFTHPRSQTNLTAWPLPQLAAAGIDGLAFNNRFTNSPAGTDLDTVFEDIALDVAAAVEHARSLGYRRVLLMGHSAGGPTMAFYQRVAERGNESLQPDVALSGFRGFFTETGSDLALPPADGLILRSITIGTAASFLVRLDGSVVDETTGERDPSLDMYAATNGFDPERGTAAYDAEFLVRYRRAQAERMNRLIDAARATLDAARSGRGRFDDDEFLVITRTRANPATVDLSLGDLTVGEYEFLPAGTVGRVRDVRAPNLERADNEGAGGAAVHRIGPLLTYRLVRTDPERFNPEAVSADDSGIDFETSNTSTPTSLRAVSVPVLVIQGSGDDSNSVKLPTAELVYDSIASSDRSLVFVEGGNHFMRSAGEGFADPRPVAVARIARWILDRWAAS